MRIRAVLNKKSASYLDMRGVQICLLFSVFVVLSFGIAISLLNWAQVESQHRVTQIANRETNAKIGYAVLDNAGAASDAAVIGFCFAVLCSLGAVWWMSWRGHLRAARGEDSMRGWIGKHWRQLEEWESGMTMLDVENSCVQHIRHRGPVRLIVSLLIVVSIALFICLPRPSVVVRHFANDGASSEALAAPFVITVICANRPEELTAVVNGLGLARYPPNSIIVFSVDGTHAGVADVIDNFFATAVLPINVTHVYQLQYRLPLFGLPSLVQLADPGFLEYRISFHIYHALHFAFDTLDAQGVAVIEDDIEPAPDAFSFFYWAMHKVLLNPDNNSDYDRVLGVKGMERPVLGNLVHDLGTPVRIEPLGEDLTLGGTGIFHHGPWGWVTSSRQWPFLYKYWAWFHGWAMSFDIAACNNGKMFLTAIAPRTKHIGLSGVHFNLDAESYAEVWDYDFGLRIFDYADRTPTIKWPNEQQRDEACVQVNKKKW
eukprot:GEMP01034103.1.p1 GENE.GEMP01034103.1~~GEMP01034103.1.p1  ORF type:complete len:487 (+),score=99.83 GEMP01034103.1:139-1599(+)